MSGRVIAGAAVVTCDPERRVLAPGWVEVDGHEIVAVEPGEPPADRVAARGDVLLPGLVSAHQHLVDGLVRGGPLGPGFLDWLLGTYHAGLAHARPDECAAAIGVRRAEGLAAGITTVVDCWSVGPVDDPARVAACADASVQAHLGSGGRTVFAPMFCEVVPDGWDASHGLDPARLCRPYEVTLAWVEDLAARSLAPDRPLRITPSPELPETSTPEGLRAALALARRLGAVLPIHLCASPPSRAAFGPDDAHALGLLAPDLLAAHCNVLDDHDVAVLGGAGVGVAHCPSASLAMGGTQFTPLGQLRAAGARAGLGLDNASIHPGTDLFEEARRARGTSARTGAPLDAGALLDLLTIEGAGAAGLGDLVGSLEAGKRADLILLDTNAPHWADGASAFATPATAGRAHAAWADHLIARARASDVRTVFVDGRTVARDGAALHPGDTATLERANTRIRAQMPW